jgi:transposase
MVKKRRRFSREYKQEVAEMVISGGHETHVLAKELDLRPDMIQRWVKQHQADPEQSFPGKGRPKQRDEELLRLQRENRLLREEREILKKVVAIFSEPRR